ncbi:MAG: hypothetical protein U0359_37220 [Byssovorax sp.]
MTTTWPHRIAQLGLVALWLTTAPAVRAQVNDQTVAAEALFDEGKTLAAAGSFAEAAEKFTASYKLDPAWGTLFNLAHCHEEMGKTATAWGEFREAAAMAKAADRSDRFELSLGRAAKLEPSLVRLQVAVNAPAPGLQVKRNGAALDKAIWNVAVPVDPGDYVVEASAPGRITTRVSVSAKGSGQTVTVSIPALAESAVPFWTQHRGSAFVAGGAVVLAAAGAGMAGWTVASHGELPVKCAGQGVKNCPDFADFQNKATATNVLFGAAGAAAVTAVVLYFTAERKGRAPTAESRVSGSPAGVLIRF